MSTLYIDRQGTQLRVDGTVLHIATSDGVGDRQLPIKYLDRVVLRSDTQLSSRVLCALARHGVNLLALGGRGGRELAQMSGTPHNDARRRWQQVLALSQPDTCAQLARSLVTVKLRRQQATLMHMQGLRPDLRKPLHDGQQRLAGVLHKLAQVPVGNTVDLDRIRGLEGVAAGFYFDAFFRGFAPALGVTGRNRRPPRDPVNAVLSLAYTLLYDEATAACWSAGLDPALGALHTLSHGRAALACDVMEPFRPAVDVWIWSCFRQGLLRAEHFGHDGAGACLLGKAGRSLFYPAWQQQARCLRRPLLRYVRRLAQALQVQMPEAWSHVLSMDEGAA